MSDREDLEQFELLGLELARARALVRAQAEELVWQARRIRELEAQLAEYGYTEAT